MEKKFRRIGVLTSGGDAPGMNAAIKSVTAAALAHGVEVVGIVGGYRGLIDNNVKYLTTKDVADIVSRGGTALYSARCTEFMEEAGVMKAVETCKKHEIDGMVVIGGDGTFRGAYDLSAKGIPCIGLPGTIDNDITATDVTIGFDTAMTTGMDICDKLRDTCESHSRCNVVELMGRNAGWLTAAAALATEKGCGPDLIYCPENAFDIDAFIERVKGIYEKEGKCIVAVSEGIRDAKGKYISEYGNDLTNAKDGFGHAQLGGLAAYLAGVLKEATGAKVRGIELSLLQRCAAHCASQTDIEESFNAGRIAVEKAVEGVTDRMVGFLRDYDENGNYVCKYGVFDLLGVANTEKKIPAEWFNETKDGLTEDYIKYALPLIQGETRMIKQDSLPRFTRLKKIKATV